MMSSESTNAPLKFLEPNKSRIFKCSRLADSVLEKLRKFYEGNEYVDLVLVAEVDNFKLNVHRIVLSAASDYFEEKFRSTLQDSGANEVELEGIDGITLKLIVDFIYSASIELRADTLESVLRAADIFKMSTLVAACCDFIGDQLDFSNCLGIALFANQHGHTALYKDAYTFARKQIKSVCKETEFFQLKEDQLIELFLNDDPCVPSEEEKFLSLVGWVEYDKTIREKSIFKLFSQVRFQLLNSKFIIRNRHLFKTTECYELICRWLQWHLLPEIHSLDSAKPSQGNKKLAFASGYFAYDLRVQTFNPRDNTWSFEDFPLLSGRKILYSVTVVNNKLVVAGGIISGRATKSVQCLDLPTNTWNDLPLMESPRCIPGIAELNGDLYVVGGADHTMMEWTRSVEKYDFSTGKWETMAPLPTPFHKVKVAVLDGLLYAVGDAYRTMDCYDPTTNEWTKKAFKNEASTQFSITGVGGDLYAVGGWFNGQISKTVERYCPSTDTWSVLQNPLKNGGCDMRCAGFNNRLVACGEINGTSGSNLVQEYDPEANEWKIIAPLRPHQFMRYSYSLFTI